LIENSNFLTHSSDIGCENFLYSSIIDTPHCEKYWNQTVSCLNILYAYVGSFKSSKRKCLLNVLDIYKIVILKRHC